LLLISNILYMALTPTKQIPLGFKAPKFNLLNPYTGNIESLDELNSEIGTLVIFMCNHCPYVIHVLDQIVKLSNEYMSKGISIIGINSNDIVNYPDDSPDNMIELIKKYKIPFPYLFDDNQDVAKAYHAACTPDFSVFNSNMTCVYRGQLDDSRPGNKNPVTGKDIRLILDSLISREPTDFVQKPSVGCNIKWK